MIEANNHTLCVGACVASLPCVVAQRRPTQTQIAWAARRPWTPRNPFHLDTLETNQGVPHRCRIVHLSTTASEEPERDVGMASIYVAYHEANRRYYLHDEEVSAVWRPSSNRAWDRKPAHIASDERRTVCTTTSPARDAEASTTPCERAPTASWPWHLRHEWHAFAR